MSTEEVCKLFRSAIIEQTTTVKAGYLSKPMPVGAVLHPSGTFIHVSSSNDWLCRALTGKSNSSAPLKGCGDFLHSLASVTFGADSTSTALAVDEPDPMEELMQDGGPSGGRPKEDAALETPKKRSRKHLTQAELEFMTVVRLSDVVDDIHIFQESERSQVSGKSLRVLIKTNRRRSLYVHEKDLDLCLLVLRRHVERMGVPHTDLSEEVSALADAPEWFDTRTSRWHVRVGNSGQVIMSDPVRRKGSDGKPLKAEVFKSLKAAALAELKGDVNPQSDRADGSGP